MGMNGEEWEELMETGALGGHKEAITITIHMIQEVYLGCIAAARCLG